MNLTAHAVERYRERWSPSASIEEAEAELRTIASNATPLKSRTLRKTELWSHGDVRLVVKRDKHVGPVVITVLPQPAPDRYAAAFEEFLSWHEENVEYLEAQGIPTPGIAPKPPTEETAESATKPAKKRNPTPGWKLTQLEKEQEERDRAWAEHFAKRNPKAEALVAKAKADHARALEDYEIAQDLQRLSAELFAEAKQRKHESRELIKRATRGDDV